MPAGEKIRVLIVDDVSETRENVKKLLQFESDVDVVGIARTGKEAIQISNELVPDVVLMDINMPDMDGIAATEAIRAKQPTVQVVILSVQSDQNYMRKAMLVGARDFLTKPPMGDELISAIRRAGEMAWLEKSKSAQVQAVVSAASNFNNLTGFGGPKGKIITVYSPKGGAGCTTIAVNLALTLNNGDTRVALVDGNFQFGDVAVFINEQGKNTVLDLAPRADKRINITPERVAENLKQEVALTIPLDEATATKAVNRGVPFVIDNKSQPVSRGVYMLAESIRGRVATQESSSESDRVARR